MANEIQTPTTGAQKIDEQQNVLSKIKGFLQKSKNSGGGQKNQRSTRAFHLTRKDSIVSILASLVVIGGAIYYGMVVTDEYREINSHTDKLKELSSYGDLKLDSDKLSSYAEDGEIKTISSLISVNNSIEAEIEENETIKKQQKNYYEILLQNIYLPSLNIWKDPYTQNFNMSVLGQKYLETDKFQDLYLIQYWSDFVKYVGNDADYNTVDTITIGEKTVSEENPKYFYIPITVSFSSPNKRSFLLLVNKLSMTSNQNNIALLNEFFFYLLKSIRENKSELINQLSQEYLEKFSSSSTRTIPKNLGEMSEDDLSIYKDRVVGYNLYHWINGDLTGESLISLIDDAVIEKAIKDSALCTNGILDQKCLYNFRDKYRNLPYLAYKIGLENQKNRTSGLLEFLQDLPPAIAITRFGFEKYSNSTFLNNKEEVYEGTVEFKAYGRNIADSELEEASTMLGKLCFGSSTEQKITPENALKYVDKAITSLGEKEITSLGEKEVISIGEKEYSNVTSLLELQTLLSSLKESYNGMSNYDKMVKLFEIRRMINDANLCNK